MLKSAYKMDFFLIHFDKNSISIQIEVEKNNYFAVL